MASGEGYRRIPCLKDVSCKKIIGLLVRRNYYESIPALNQSEYNMSNEERYIVCILYEQP